MYDENLIMLIAKNQCQQQFESHNLLLTYSYPNNEILPRWLVSSVSIGICGFIKKVHNPAIQNGQEYGAGNTTRLTLEVDFLELKRFSLLKKP